MQNLLHTRLLLLFLSTTLVIAGCIAFGAKKIAANKTQQPDLLALPTNPQNCIKILKTSKVNKIDPYYYSYLLDTTDAKCTARTLRDIINDTIFIQKGVNDSLVGSPQLHKGKNSFSHYYKGIKVDGSGIGMYVENNKIVSVITNFYPHLNIDTTGMLSKEEAVKIAFSHAEIYEGFNTLEWQQYVASHTETLINPQKHIVYYGFYIPRISKKNGGYFVDATNKRFMKYVPGWGGSLLTDCHKCVGASTTQFSCEDTCATNTCTVFTDGVLVAVPTLYDGCQSILADECTIDNKTVYRMAPDTINLTVNDSINVYDGSKYYGGPKAQKIAWCFADSSISKKNTIATTAWYGIKTARSYFAAHAIDYQAPIKVLVHFPESPFDPIGNDALWDQKDKLFIFGSGDDTIMTAPVSVDIVAHEYAHAVLHNKFNIGSHVTNDTSAHRYEAGALHEGIADIFSVLVRKHAYGTINWVIGDEVLIPTSTTLLPRDLAHPENTTPPQALYYNDPAANWDTTQTEIYNHAGIIAKWFYLLANGGTGYHYATDSITVEPLTIDTAEMVLIGGLKKIDSLVLDIDKLTIPSYAEFAVAMAAAAQTISCTTHKQTIRALKAVGLGLNLPGGKTTLLTEDESLCFIDLRMRDCYNDQGFEPNTECDDWLGWNDIWNSPDLWVCPQNDSCYLAASAPPEPAQSNRIGFTIYNAHPNLISDPAELHLYYTMASSGELWDFNWIDWYFTAGDYTCYLGDEIATSPVAIPEINPNDFFTGWTTWSPPNFVNPNLPFYADPVECWLSPETDPLDGELKYEICLLARLLSEADPIRNETFDNITHNVIYNNNIVTKNLFFLNPGLGIGGGIPPTIAGTPSVMFICNNNATSANLNIVYQQIANGLGQQGSNDSIEVSLILSPQLWDNWVQTGQQGEGITLLTQREVRIDNYATAKLLNIPFAAYERQPIAIKTTILTSGGKTTTNQLSINNPVFSFYLTHESSNQQTINPSSKCQFVLNNKQMQQHDNTNEIKLIAYPNPVTNQSGYLQFMLPQAENISVAIYNLSGKKVQQIVSNQPYEAGLHQLPVSTAQLTDGIYICHLTTTNKTVATKFVTLTR